MALLIALVIALFLLVVLRCTLLSRSCNDSAARQRLGIVQFRKGRKRREAGCLLPAAVSYPAGIAFDSRDPPFCSLRTSSSSIKDLILRTRSGVTPGRDNRRPISNISDCIISPRETLCSAGPNPSRRVDFVVVLDARTDGAPVSLRRVVALQK